MRMNRRHADYLEDVAADPSLPTIDPKSAAYLDGVNSGRDDHASGTPYDVNYGKDVEPTDAVARANADAGYGYGYVSYAKGVPGFDPDLSATPEDKAKPKPKPVPVPVKPPPKPSSSSSNAGPVIAVVALLVVGGLLLNK